MPSEEEFEGPAGSNTLCRTSADISKGNAANLPDKVTFNPERRIFPQPVKIEPKDEVKPDIKPEVKEEVKDKVTEMEPLRTSIKDMEERAR